MIDCLDPSKSSSFQLLATLKHLNRHYSLAIDDFGVGAFRLAHLDSLKPQFLKIDGSFTKALPSEKAFADLSALILISKARGCKVILEWVETAAQIEIARSLGIDYCQGWGVAKPEPLAVS
jgi:EAL domain-containing protein (putative c-di-GMP-specific phosphodiesterase class I)